jgi:hypothetical protein
MMAFAMVGCAVEAEDEASLDFDDAPSMEATYVPVPSPTCTPSHTTYTTTSTFQSFVQQCGGYNLVGAQVYCNKYETCTKTTTWGKDWICDDPLSAAAYQYTYIIKEEISCSGLIGDNCGGLLKVMCW